MSKTALIIEDDLPSCKLLEKIFLKKEYKVTTCKNGAEGLYRFFTNPNYDIITLDIMMPGVGGLDFINVVEDLYKKKIIKENPYIIVETAVKNFDQLKYITSHEIVHTLINKPLDIAALEETIDLVQNCRTVRANCVG